MSIKAEYQRSHAAFPWLSLDDPEGVERCLARQGLLTGAEVVRRVSKAGEGNMNLTLLVETDHRRLVLKQARPWVEKYDHIPAPWERILFEQRFYNRAASIPEVARRSPSIIAVDSDARTIAMEYLDSARDFTGAYEGETVAPDELELLAGYLGALHDATQGKFDESLANREMRALNHEHIFLIPVDPENGLDLDRWEPGLKAAAARLAADEAFLSAVSESGDRYLADGPCLLHGDYFPGSWLRTPRGVYVIDPEFCFYGDPEFDLGVAVAHFALARRPVGDATLFLTAYGTQFNAAWLARYAGIEVVRRLAGVAQLPIPPTADFRVRLLMRARKAVVEGRYELLWD